MKAITLYSIGLNLILFLFPGFQISYAQPQINIKNFPSKIGTIVHTDEDTNRIVVVGELQTAGNYIWRFDYPYEGRQATQEIIDKESSPFQNDFPNSNCVILYEGKLGDLVYSRFFSHIYGKMFSYQENNPEYQKINGVGMVSSGFTGPVIMQPGIQQFSLPLEIGKKWHTSTEFSIEVDTVLFGLPTTLEARLKINIENEVDAWGTVILPENQFECLRVKSYLNLNEKLFALNSQLKEHTSRTIYYFWVAPTRGIIVRLISRENETNDNFTIAHQISRLKVFRIRIAPDLGFPKTGPIKQPTSYPNPFNASTNIIYYVPSKAHIRLDIFNLHGQQINRLRDEVVAAGWQNSIWNGKNNINQSVSTGVYFYRINLSENDRTRLFQGKICLIR